MIAHKKRFFSGLGLLATFTVVLILFFSPIFAGHNGLDYLDNLYNAISKGSAYYVPQMKEEVQAFHGQQVQATLNLHVNEQAEQTERLFRAGGADTEVTEGTLQVTGDLGQILANSLADADAMYHNNGQLVSDKYGYNERQVLFNWWRAFHEMEKDLKRQKEFKAADGVALITKKAVETSYNYYQIEPQKIMDKVWLVVLSLVFYVIYTMWYGFGFMYVFEGWGLKLEH